MHIFNLFERGRALSVLLALSVLMAACGGGGDGSGLRLESTFEQGELYRTPSGLYRVAVVRGPWREMGRQYGGLLAPTLRAFHDEITADVSARGMDREQQIATARAFPMTYSENLRELLAGMAETSGLSEDETLVLNAGMVLLTQVVLGGEPPAACSGISASEAYTPDGRLVFGRNWDIEREAMLRYMKYLGVVVFKPDDGLAFANIHPLGNVYVETGLNSRGVFVELNNGEQSDPAVYEDREDTTSYLAEVLTDSSTREEAVAMLEDKPADISYILQVVDRYGACSVERATFGARVRQARNGLLVAYNSFVPPYPDAWEGRVNPPPPEENDPRYVNLIHLADSDRFFGRLDVQGMKELIAIPVEQGGALHAGTVLQVVAVPEDLTVWIRGVDYSDFEEVELGGLLGE